MVSRTDGDLPLLSLLSLHLLRVSVPKTSVCRFKTSPCVPARRAPVLPQEPLFGKRTWTDIEPEEYSISDYEVSKKLIRLLRHARIQREDDGAIEFWRIKDNLQKHFQHCHHWSDDRWKKSVERGGGNKKRYQYCTDSSGTMCISELFKVIQDAISLILLCRTMYLFRTTSSDTFNVSDGQSMYIPSSIRD